ncbi:hypothetical protein V6N13_004698 [Hibiscus sabdariffa]
MLPLRTVDLALLVSVRWLPVSVRNATRTDIVTKKRKVESYKTVAVASEYCAGRIDLPMKKKDPSSFIIPCSIGDNFMGNALCDLGSSVNLMPKAMFKKIGIGIERPTTVILQLADRFMSDLKARLKM